MDFDTTGAFVDNALMVLVARHQPPLEETDEFGDRVLGIMQNSRWNLVAASLQTQVLMRPTTDTERLALRWVDPQHFNPAVCRHRAQYILWRQRKQLEEKKKNNSSSAAQNSTENGVKKKTMKKEVKKDEVSDFNVLTSAGLKMEVDQLMADVRSKLPTVAPTATTGDSEDDDEDVEIFRPPTNMLQTEHDVAQAEAEAVLLQHVQDMQLEHYKRYHKWVETSYSASGAASGGLPPTGLTNNNYAASHTGTAGGGFSSSNNGTPVKYSHSTGNNNNNRSGLVSHDDVQDIPLDQCTSAQVGDLLGFLGIPEHLGKFRRTTGRLLLQLKKEDLRERFGDDCEAADLLWTHIEDNRVAVPSAAMVAAQKRGGGGGSSSSSTVAQTAVRRLYEDARAPSSNLSNQTQNLKSFESSSSNPKKQQQHQTQVQEMLSRGDVSSLKRSLNPNRPARPSTSEEVYDYSTSEDDVNLGAEYLRGLNSEASTPEKRRQPTPTMATATGGVSKSMGGGYQRPPGGNIENAPSTSTANHIDPSSSSSSSSVTKKTTTAATAPTTNGSNARANRWAVVEYSDEDSDDN